MNLSTSSTIGHGLNAPLPPRPQSAQRHAATTHRNTRMFRLIVLCRIGQLVLVTVYLPLLVYATAHKGWWMDVQNPLILGS